MKINLRNEGVSGRVIQNELYHTNLKMTAKLKHMVNHYIIEQKKVIPSTVYKKQLLQNANRF